MPSLHAQELAKAWSYYTGLSPQYRSQNSHRTNFSITTVELQFSFTATRLNGYVHIQTTNHGAQCRAGTPHTLVDKTSTTTPGCWSHPKSCRTETICFFLSYFPQKRDSTSFMKYCEQRSRGLGFKKRVQNYGFPDK